MRGSLSPRDGGCRKGEAPRAGHRPRQRGPAGPQRGQGRGEVRRGSRGAGPGPGLRRGGARPVLRDFSVAGPIPVAERRVCLGTPGLGSSLRERRRACPHLLRRVLALRWERCQFSGSGRVCWREGLEPAAWRRGARR